MATQLLTGTIELMAVSDGSQLELRMGTNGNRTQYFDDAGNHYPDYEASSGTASRPKFWPIVTDTTNNQPLAIIAGTGIWKYNGATLVFGGTAGDAIRTCTGTTTDSSYAGMFQLDQYEIATGVTVPRLTVIKNLASTTNDDSDTIEFTGSVNLTGGNPFEVSMGSFINISRLAAGTTDAISIYALDGQEFDYDNSTSDNLRFQPYIIAGNVEKGNNVPTGYSLHVYGIGIYAAANSASTLNKTVAGGASVTHLETINQDQINDEGILVFELLKGSTVVATSAIQIYDNGDPDNVTITAVATKNGATRPVTRDVKVGETVTLTVTVSDRNTGVDKTSSYNSFVWYALNHAGTSATTLANRPATASNATSMTITYAEIKAAGGVFIACSCSKNMTSTQVATEIIDRYQNAVQQFDATYFGIAT